MTRCLSKSLHSTCFGKEQSILNTMKSFILICFWIEVEKILSRVLYHMTCKVLASYLNTFSHFYKAINSYFTNNSDREFRLWMHLSLYQISVKGFCNQWSLLKVILFSSSLSQVSFLSTNGRKSSSFLISRAVQTSVGSVLFNVSKSIHVT